MKTRPIPQADVAERFWSKVDKTDGCWLWRGARGGGGRYGHFSIHCRAYPAHRVAFTLTNGPIPDGLLVCHTCDNYACVRPDHLFLGTQCDNMVDMTKKGRGRPNGGRPLPTHCVRGHAYDEANTYYPKTGGRICRECHRLFALADRERRRGDRPRYARIPRAS